MRTYSGFEEGRIKHLELIQAVVSRLGGNGFLMKGWALTISGAFAGFAVNNHDGWLAVTGLVPTLVFWGLDAYFLRAERLFRKLYDQVCGADDIDPFFLSATSSAFVNRLTPAEQKSLTWHRTLYRPSLLWFYVTLLLATLAVILILVTDSSPGSLPVPSPAKSTSTLP